MHVPVEGDYGAAFGAARLSLIADTGQASLEICSEPVIAETIEPVAAMADAFEQAFERYRVLYSDIQYWRQVMLLSDDPVRE